MIDKIKNIFTSSTKDENSVTKFNTISKPTNVILNIFFGILAALCIIPFLFILIISLTSEAALLANGYQFWPEEWSLGAYKYILASGDNIIRSYGITNYSNGGRDTYRINHYDNICLCSIKKEF